VKTCADGIVINVVVGGEVITLKNIEESSSLVIAEMPINVSLLHVPCSSINEFEIQGRK
jgi:translation initiation factor 4A